MTEEVKDAVVRLVCNVMNCEVSDIMNHSRKNVEPRHMAMYVMNKCVGIGPSEIAKYFGFNHATVIHARQNIERLFCVDTGLIYYFRQLQEHAKAIDIVEQKEAENAELFRRYAELKHQNRRLQKEIEALREENKILRAAMPIKYNVA